MNTDMLTDWEVNWGLLLLWKKETAHRSLPILNNPLNTNPNLTIHWTPRIRLQYILTTSPTLNSSVHINRICFHIVHHYSLLCVSYPNNQSSIKKKHKNHFYFFLFSKNQTTPNQADRTTFTAEEDEDHGVTGFEVQPGRIGSGCVSDRHGR